MNHLEGQLAEQWTGSFDVFLKMHSSLKLWIHRTQIQWVPPGEEADPAAAFGAETKSWTYTPGGDLKFLCWKKTVTPNTG